MSTFKIEVVRINGVMPHPNADRLDIVQVKDWQCVTQKGKYNVGSRVIYIPIDSLLPESILTKLFPEGSKVVPKGGRIRTIKLRGAISQGMVADLSLFPEHNQFSDYDYTDGDDLSGLLGITKYEPEVKGPSSTLGKSTNRNSNPNFKKYGGIENAKNYPEVFKETDEVVVTEKIHGSHVRCGWVTFHADTLFKKVKKLLGLAPKYEFVYGSNNVQLQNSFIYNGYHDSNIYAEIVKKYNLKDILKPGEVLHGEVYGDGVQAGYLYDCKKNERKGIFFDLKRDGKFLDPIEFKHWAKEVNIPIVPQLYVGVFNKEKILKLRDGVSVLSPNQKIREGVVVKPLVETTCYIGRKLLKYISDEYLLKNQDSETLPH